MKRIIGRRRGRRGRGRRGRGRGGRGGRRGVFCFFWSYFFRGRKKLRKEGEIRERKKEPFLASKLLEASNPGRPLKFFF